MSPVFFATRNLMAAVAAAASAPGAAKKVAFIGLGNMGGHMAANLLKQGFEVSAFDISQEANDRAAALGASVASTPAAAALGASTVITMLPANDHVKHAYLGDDGILSTLLPGSLCIDSSTVDPAVSRAVAMALSGKGIGFVDAPVSGGVGGAEKGTLTFMVGGEINHFEQSKEVLSAMGSNIVHCGEVGTGEIAKLCNNMLLATSMSGVSEAMNLGSKLGMDRKKLASIINTSTGKCWSSEAYNPAPGVMEGVPSANAYAGGFASKLMLKDLGLAMDAARGANVETPIGKEVTQLYGKVCEDPNMANQDFGVMFKYVGGTDEDPKK